MRRSADTHARRKPKEFTEKETLVAAEDPGAKKLTAFNTLTLTAPSHQPNNLALHVHSPIIYNTLRLKYVLHTVGSQHMMFVGTKASSDAYFCRSRLLPILPSQSIDSSEGFTTHSSDRVLTIGLTDATAVNRVSHHCFCCRPFLNQRKFRRTPIFLLIRCCKRATIQLASRKPPEPSEFCSTGSPSSGVCCFANTLGRMMAWFVKIGNTVDRSRAI